MDNIEEKISALYDGELNDQEMDEVLLLIEKDPNLHEKISKYGLLTSAIKYQNNNIQSIIANRKKSNFNFWLSNSITAAAAVLITFFSLNQFDLNRMGEDLSAKNQINTAINSKEAKDIAKKAQDNLVDHIMQIINNSQTETLTPYNIDLRNVGYT